MLESAFPVKSKSTSVRPAARPTKSPAVPLLDLSRQYLAIREQVLAAVERVCASQHFILGAEVEALERDLARFVGVAAAVGCASGTDALWLALLAAGVQPSDQVITTPFSFFASSSAIVRAGARPLMVDIDPATLNIDPAQVEAKLRTARDIRAILPVHLYGQCADMDALSRLAEEFKVPIVEDAAQAIGARWRNQHAGSLGLVAAFSFYPTKNLSAYGEAGAVTTQDRELAERMQRLRNHGSPKRYHHEEFGWNSRLDAIQAAILRVKLPYVEEWNKQRRERAARYDYLLANAGLTSSAGHSPIRPLSSSPYAHHVYHQYVIRARARDALRNFLSERNIGNEVYYPIPLHLQPSFAYLGYQEGDLPKAERAAREVLAIPMFPELTEEEQSWVVESIAEFYS